MLELNELLNSFIKSTRLIVIVTVAAGLAGLTAYYLLPAKYIASGSFYIQREVEDRQGEFFTYEGYYGQQTALSYTNTVAGLFESLDVGKKALEYQNKLVNETNLRRIARQIQVRKEAPQLLTLIVKEKDPSSAEALWSFISATTLDTADELNLEGDPHLKISPVGEFVVKKEFSSPLLNLVTGAGIGFILSIAGISLKTYLRKYS